MELIIEQKVLDLGIKIVSIFIKNLDNTSYDKRFVEWRNNKINELIEKYSSYDVENDTIIKEFYEIHKNVGIIDKKEIPSSLNLINMLLKRKDLVHINKVVDIYNIISMESRLSIGAHDAFKIDGNVHMKICDGSEEFIPIGRSNASIVSIKPYEYALVDDSNEIICHLDVRQSQKTKVDNNTKSVIYFLIGNKETSVKYLKEVADKIVNLTLEFCGGSAKIIF